MATPWAPTQHEGMSCACGHWDAHECSRSREMAGSHYWDGQDDGRELDERCDCCCHDRDIDEDYDTDDPRYWTG